MSVRIHCPFCDQKYDLDDFKEGVEVECAKCSQKFTLEMSLIDTTGDSGGIAGRKTSIPIVPESPPVQKVPGKPDGEEKKSSTPPPKETKKEPGSREKRGFPISTICQAGSFLALLVVAFILLAMLTEKTKYTYRVKEVDGNAYDTIQPESRRFYAIDLSDALDEQYELMAAIPLVETIQKNYGNSEYVTGLRPHTRTSKVLLVLRRKNRMRFYQSDYWK